MRKHRGDRRGTRFSFGAVCPNHLEENGRRYASNGACVGCKRELGRALRGKAQHNIVARMRAVRGPARFKHKWQLNDGQALWLIAQPCVYCGEPSLPGRFGGIDRAKNEYEYEPLNSVPACERCNMMKKDLPVREFIVACCAVAALHGNYEIFKAAWLTIREELECRS